MRPLYQHDCLCEVVHCNCYLCVCRKLIINVSPYVCEIDVSPYVCIGNEGYGSATSMERGFQEIAENVQHFSNNGNATM